MIRILHIIDTTGPGGAETVFVNLVKGMVRNDMEPVVVIRGPGWVCDELERNGITPLIIDSTGSFDAEYLWGLIKIIRRRKIDIIQSHLLGANLYGSLAGLVCGVPVVSTFHGFVDVSARERCFALKSKIINLGSDRIVFVSERLKDHYVKNKHLSKGKSAIIYNGVDTSLFKPFPEDSVRKELGLGPSHILVGAVGNMRPAKGYNYLLQAARSVIDRNPMFRFVVAGEGSGRLRDELLDLRKQLNLEDHFHFIGFQSAVPRLLNNLDIFVLPSVSEGFSISTIEAMACGVPVVATSSGGPEEIITNGWNGILVEARSCNQLSDALLKVQENDSGRKRIIENALQSAVQDFSFDKMISRYDEIYKLLGK